MNQGKTSAGPKSLVIRPATESSSNHLAASFILCHGESPFTRGRHYSMGELLVPQLRAVTRDNSRSVLLQNLAPSSHGIAGTEDAYHPDVDSLAHDLPDRTPGHGGVR